MEELSDALDLPAHEFSKRYSFEKPSPSDELLFYCRSGGRSRRASFTAFQHGYKNCKTFEGGYLRWLDNSTITKKDVQALINSGEKYFLIDVRSAEEVNGGMIPTAKHIHISDVLEAFFLTPAQFRVFLLFLFY